MRSVVSMRQRGAALLIALALSAALAAICQSLLERGTIVLQRARMDVEVTQAFHAADAALTLCMSDALGGAAAKRPPKRREVQLGDTEKPPPQLMATLDRVYSFGARGLAGTARCVFHSSAAQAPAEPSSAFADGNSSGDIAARTVIESVGHSPSRMAVRRLKAIEVRQADGGERFLWVDPLEP